MSTTELIELKTLLIDMLGALFVLLGILLAIAFQLYYNKK